MALLQGSRYDRRIWVLFWSRLIDGAGFSIVYPFLTIYMSSILEVPMTLVGLVILVAGVAGAVGSIAGGIWADAYGRRQVMVLSMLARTLSFLVLALVIAVVPDLWLIAALLAINFFLGGAFDPANNAMVADVVEPAKQLEAYGLLRVAWNLGFAIGPAIGGLIVTASYLMAFMASAAVSFVAALVVLLFLKESYVPKKRARTERGRLDLSGISLPFLAFCFFCVPMFIMAGQFSTTFPVFANERLGIDQFIIGVVFGINGLMVAVIQLPLARWLSRFNRFASMLFGTLVYSLGFMCLALISGGVGLAVCMVVITFGEMVVTPVSTSLTAAYSHEDDRGRYMGVFGLIASLGWFTSSLVGGLIYDNVASGLVLWGVMALMGVITAMGMALLWQRSRTSHGVGSAT
ncbi:MAG: MFS transporter [Methanomassiliicoccales archaeon]|jgi:MFS family permease|nr:MFS transporter [Methanomassiliicoccales archaeon]